MRKQWRVFLERRGAAAIVFGLFVAGGVVFVFAGSLARATELEAQAAQARAEVTALEARVAAGRAEVAFLEEDAFVDQQARANGYGEQGEQRFRLPDEAPSPPAIMPLGTSDDDASGTSPLEAWLQLLFGS
jgi:cell division protein FtsB